MVMEGSRRVQTLANPFAAIFYASTPLADRHGGAICSLVVVEGIWRLEGMFGRIIRVRGPATMISTGCPWRRQNSANFLGLWSRLLRTTGL